MNNKPIVEENYAPDSSEKDLTVCASCLAQNYESASHCQNCGYQLDSTSTLDPLKTIQAEGFMLRKATEGKPKFIVVLGIWIMFLPFLAAGIALAISQIFDGSGFAGFVFFWLGVGLAYVGFIMLYRTTLNYMSGDKNKDNYPNE